MNKDLVRSIVNYQTELVMDDSSDRKELIEAYAQAFAMIQNGKEPSNDLIKSSIEFVKLIRKDCDDMLELLTEIYEEE